jgi:hypothetical protein
MNEKIPADKIPLTLLLSPDVAFRLKAAAEMQKRAPSDLAADILDRNLPRAEPGEGRKGKIPYS